MVHWFTSNPIYFGIASLVLMWSDWLLTVFQERERRAHYSEHYLSYPLNTIEGHPWFQSAVSRARLVEPKHLLPSLILSGVVSSVMAFLPDQWRELFLGYVRGLYLLVLTTHTGNLIGYRASRRGLHGTLYLHQRTGYLIQMGRYVAFTAFLLVLTACSASLCIGGITIAGVTGIVRQLVFLRKVPPIPEDDRPPDEPINATG